MFKDCILWVRDNLFSDIWNMGSNQKLLYNRKIFKLEILKKTFMKKKADEDIWKKESPSKSGFLLCVQPGPH